MNNADENEKTIYEELPESFEGKAQQSGWTFRKIRQTDFGYVYEKSCADVSHPYYEVFKRRTVKAHVRTFPNGDVRDYPPSVIYPSETEFGVWAWCCGSFGRALEILESFKDK